MTEESTTTPKNGKKRLIIGVVTAIVAVIALIGVLAWRTSIINQGLSQQNDIIQLQKNVELEISTCLDKGATAAKVAEKEFATLKDVLVNVTAARYEGGNGALSQGGPLISALVEAYPTIDTSTWKTLMGIVTGCRDDIRDRQERLQGFATKFTTWYQAAPFGEKWIRNNFPTDELTTIDRKNGAILKGKDALDYLTRVISVKDAQEAMKNGQMPDQELFPNTASAPPSK